MRLSPWALSLALIAGAVGAPLAHAGSIQFLAPFGSSFGIAYGVDGQNVVGESNIGWWYDGSTYHVIQPPGGGAVIPKDISGDNIVGLWGKSGFVYNTTSSSFTTLPHPLGVGGTFLNGIDGAKIVGSYIDASGKAHGFLYDGGTWMTLDVPGAKSTGGGGISGNRIIGNYTDSQGGRHGYLFDGATYTTLDDPLFTGAGSTSAYGIDGDNVVGYTSANAGQLIASFIYDGSTYTHPFDVEAEFMGGHHFNGISGNRIVGEFNDQPFIYTIPEPASLALALFAALALPLARWRSHSRGSPA